jgi:hypothetical protein
MDQVFKRGDLVDLVRPIGGSAIIKYCLVLDVLSSHTNGYTRTRILREDGLVAEIALFWVNGTGESDVIISSLFGESK